MELWLVADTNLFFECKPLNQLPWDALGHDHVVVLLTKPVLDEIDKHKNGAGRTRTRALEIFGLVRKMLATNVREAEIRPSTPRVLLRLGSFRPDPSLKDDLDYGRTDERLVGIVSTLQAVSAGHVVKLFTDDTGPASTASGLGLPFEMIDAGWRRPPSETTETKRIKELEKDLATYRAQEPRILISSCEYANASNIVAVTCRVASALTQAEAEDILLSLVAKHPQRTEFVPPPPSSITKADGEIVRTEYLAPPSEALSEYRNVLYPRWIDECRGILAKLHQGRGEKAPPLIIRWPMSNIGTRPASHVRVEFQARGALKLMRLSYDPNEEIHVPGGANAETPARSVSTPNFPSPPQAPTFQANITRTPPPTRPNMMPRPSGVAYAASDFLGRNHGGFALSALDIERARLTTSSQRFGLGVSAAEAAGLLRSNSLFEPPYGSVNSITAMPLPLPQFSALPFEAPHDSEAFYWDWPVDEAVETGALTCDLWRHQAGEEVFEFEVLFDHEGEARGSIECTVHAENLTKPEQARVIVGRTIEQFAVKDIAERMVEACR